MAAIGYRIRQNENTKRARGTGILEEELKKLKDTRMYLSRAIEAGRSQMTGLSSYLRDRLIIAKPVIGMYVENRGYADVRWGRPLPGSFLDDPNT